MNENTSAHNGIGVQVWRRSDVRAALQWPQLLQVAEEALVAVSSPSALPAVSTQLLVPGASLHLKAGALLDPPVISIKANLRPDSGSASGAVLVFDYEGQQLRAIVASGDLTAMRTAAIAAIATRTLVTKTAPVVAILGAGPVARYTDEALAYLGIPGEVRIWSRSPERAAELVASASGAAGADGVPVTVVHRACATVAEAVSGADVVVTCTPSRTPVLQLDELDPHAVVIAMGADGAGKRELGPGILEAAMLYVDVARDALRVGECEFLSDDQAGRVTELGTVFAGGAAHADGLVVFDSVGSSAVDAAVVGLLVGRPDDDQGGLLYLND
ncbi:MAG TPA: NAD(P)-binding domain-containing protein [Microbacteriaceae bacterium]|jgi:ornithine cyclodeaminase/alanine dehydrogenase-like protein (mu-crystallin family)|nr:NAD(P)-binding domain-containing protein [Microbacteriaceae bacterium]